MNVSVFFNHLWFFRVAITSPFRLYEQSDELILVQRGRQIDTEVLRQKLSYLWMTRNYPCVWHPGITDDLLACGGLFRKGFQVWRWETCLLTWGCSSGFFLLGVGVSVHVGVGVGFKPPWILKTQTRWDEMQFHTNLAARDVITFGPRSPCSLIFLVVLESSLRLQRAIIIVRGFLSSSIKQPGQGHICNHGNNHRPITGVSLYQEENSPAGQTVAVLTSALSLPVAYGGVDQVAACRPVAMAFAALLAEPRSWQEVQTRRVCLRLLEVPEALTRSQVKQQRITTSCFHKSADIRN